MNINNPFENFQLSSGSRPRIKAVINLKRRSPISVLDGHIHQQDLGLLRVSQSKKELRTIFRTKPSKSKIKIHSLPPIKRSSTEDKQSPPTPKFKNFSNNRKKIRSIDNEVKRNGRVRFFDHIKKQKLVDVSFNEDFKSFYLIK